MALAHLRSAATLTRALTCRASGSVPPRARFAPSAPENRTTSPALKSCTPTTVTETPSAQSYAELSAQDKKLTCATFLYW